MSQKLTEKQIIFIAEYLVDFNGTRAAIAAGYSEKNAAQQALENLRKPYIQDAIRQQREKFITQNEDLKTRLVNHLRDLAFADASDFSKFKNGELKITDTEKLTTKQRQAIGEMSQSKTSTGTNVKFKLVDKMKAAELLGRHLGIFNDKLDLTTGGDKITAESPLSPEERRELDELRKKNGSES